MKKERILNGIEILRKAIDNGVSVKKASVMCGFSDTYFKNTKKQLMNSYSSGSVDEKSYDEFNKLYTKYSERSLKPSKSDVNTKIESVEEVKSEKVSFIGNNKSNEATFEWKSPYAPDHIKTLDQLLEKCQVNQDIWEVNDYLVNKWDVTSWKQGEPKTVENFQVKARLKKKYDDVTVDSAVSVFEKLVNKYTPPVYNSPINHKSKHTLENNLLEISLFDLHIGKFGWSGEVNGEFNSKIATERFMEAIITLIERANGFGYKKILFPVGNDFLNVDNMNYTTAGNTPQQDDVTWQQSFQIGSKLLVDAINIMKQTGAEVDVVVVPGNHDYERSFYLGSFLEAWFKDDEMVDVDNRPTPRKYYEYGKLLLGLTHGKYEKEASLPMLMATENKEAWGRTDFHEWHLGHLHRKRSNTYTVLDKSKMINEDLGVTVRYLSSLSGDETWHNKMGFVGCTKAGEAFIWNDDTGLIGQINMNITNKK